MGNGELTAMQGRDEILRIHIGLLEYPVQSADTDFLMVRYHAAPVAVTHDDVAASLPRHAEAESL